VYGTILVLTLLIGAVVAGCGSTSSNVLLGADDNGSKITLTRGQIVAITLESNPTTGFGWQVIPSSDKVLVQLGEAEFKESPRSRDMVGVGGVETLRFEAKNAGQTTLELAYRRPWEKDAKPVETFSVQITVK
jgi:inhibitor of cysteine peptidase